MELTNEFTVDVPVDQAWAVLTDLERIAPCMPGARLQEVQGDDYLGTVRVKVGPVTAEYRGKAQFLERDAASHKAVLRAQGRETRGQGNASATIRAQLQPSGSGTHVAVTTELSVSGRVAQLGRGVLADVSNKLLGQFVEQLESTVLGAREPDASDAPSATARPSGGVAAPTDRVGMPAAEQGAPAGEQLEAPRATRVAPETNGVAAETNGASPEPDGATAGSGTATSAGEAEPAPVNLLRVVGPVVARRLVVPALLGLLFFVWRRRRRRR